MDLRERQGGMRRRARRHPWEVARGRFFRRLIADHVDLTTCRRVLDIGAGDGWFADQLSADLPPDANVVCWDINYADHELAAPVPPGVRRTAEPPDGTFDIVAALDVIEHVHDDAGFLDNAVIPRLHSGSLLVISVPAYQRLFCSHDEMLEHFRRYEPAALRSLLSSRSHIVESGALFASLLPPRAAIVAIERRRRRRVRPEGIGSWHHGEALTRLTTAALDADAAMCRWAAHRRVPIPGLSTWAVCRPTHGPARSSTT